MNGNILLNDTPLIVPPTLAVVLGQSESIILQQIHYWLERSDHVKLDRKWVYLTYDQLVEQIPFISKSTIRRKILKLEKQGYLFSQNFNRLKIDKTKWYSINYEYLNELLTEDNVDEPTIIEDEQPLTAHPEKEVCPEWAEDELNVNSPCAQSEQSSDSTWHVQESSLNTPLPEITTEITTKITSKTSSSSKDLLEFEVKEDPYRFFEQNGFGTIGSFLADKIKTWCTDLSDELVIEAMKIAVENSSKRWNYVEAVLRDWVDKGYKTLDDVHAARLVYKRKMKHQTRKRPTRQEYIPDWLHNCDHENKPNHHPSFEEDKRVIDEHLKSLKGQEIPHPQKAGHNPSFEEKKRLFEQRLKMNKGNS